MTKDEFNTLQFGDLVYDKSGNIFRVKETSEYCDKTEFVSLILEEGRTSANMAVQINDKVGGYTMYEKVSKLMEDLNPTEFVVAYTVERDIKNKVKRFLTEL